MKKFLIGVLVGLMYLSLLFGAFYKGVVDECTSRGYNAAFVGYIGAVCINMGDLEREDFHIEVGSF